MTTNTPVSSTETPTASAPDMAPSSPVQHAGNVGSAVESMTTPARTHEQALLTLDPVKRQKTWGENIFNLATYGGIALLGNEASSLLITQAVKNGPTKGLYAKGLAWAEKFKNNKLVPAYASHGQLQAVLVAVLGGMAMVPFVKHMEDHKGEIVRDFDLKHYGDRANTDPKLVEAHKEMDEAPKQTWDSLWKGRLLTVAAAIGVDSLIGWEHAPSTKLFAEGTTLNRFSSMDRIAKEAATFTVDALKIHGPKRASTMEWVKQGTWLMTLSTTLTVLFYASSKLFAKSREQKLERQHAKHLPTTMHSTGHADEASPIAAHDSSNEQPRAQVSKVTHERTVAGTPELAQGI